MPAAEIEIRVFDPLAAAPEEWARFHVFRRARHQEHRPDDPIFPDDLAETQMKTDAAHPDYFERQFIAVRGDAIVGSSFVAWTTEHAPGYATGKHIAYVGAGVLRAERRRGIGTRLFRDAVALTDPARHTVLSTPTDEDDGHVFLQHLGFAERSKGAENRLDLRMVDWDMVEAWIDAGRKRSPDTTLVLLEQRVPEELLATYCKARSEFLNTMPFDDLEHGEIVITPESIERDLYRWIDDTHSVWLCYVAIEPDGTVSGMTDVNALPTEPDRIQQFFTGVRPDCRGRGLGKWIKAAMLDLVRARFPEARWVITGNADSNAAMLAINARLGFRAHRHGSTYQAARDDVARRLSLA